MEQSAVTCPAGLDSLDLTRALVCATAISKVDDPAGIYEAFRVLTPDIQFQKIHLCPESNEQRFLMAHAGDAVFVAFQSTKKLRDYACDMMLTKIKLGLGSGSYHKGIYRRSKDFLGLMGRKMLPSFLKLKKRVIFCGHSLGGAVAHMVLMRMLLENEVSVPPEPLKPRSLVSIAFGAPHLCDKAAAALINKNPDFKGRFVTFVNGRDPIPRLLHHLPSTIEAVVSGAKAFVNAESSLAQLIDLAGNVLHYLSTGEVYEDNISSVSSDHVSCESWEEVKEIARKGAVAGNEYVPFGSYVFLRRDSTFREEDSTSEYVDNSLRAVQLDDECFAEHACTSYLRALADVSLIPKPQHPDQTVDIGKSLTAVSPQPEVLEARGEAVECVGVKSYLLQIKGKNLLLLRKVSWNDVEIKGNEIVESTDESMVIMHALSAKDRRAHEKIKKRGALTTVKVETSFGSCQREVSEANVLEPEKCAILLKKLVLGVRVLAKLDIFPTEEELKCLDVIMRCAPTFAELMNRTARGLKDSKELSKMADAAAAKIDQPLVFEFKPGRLAESIDFNQAARDTALFGIKAGGVAGAGAVGVAVGITLDPTGVAAGAALISAMSSALGVAAGAGLSGVVLVGGAAGWVILKGTDQLIRFSRILHNKCYSLLTHGHEITQAVEELHLWNKKKGEFRTADKATYTEDDLVKQVDGASEEFTAMLKSAISTVPTEELSGELKLKTKAWSSATDESIREFLRKVHAIVETKKLYKQIVLSKFFVAVVGQEDAGKSSFIRTQVPEYVKTSEVGITVHTENVTPYDLKNGIILLDFPGINGITGDFSKWWEEFDVMPTIIVLLLKFDHRIKEEQIKAYEDVKNILRSRILVVFNKVDNEVNARTLPTYTEPSYFPNLKEATSSRLNCRLDDVFYAALDPLEEKESVMAQLKTVGVVDVKDFMEKLVALRQENSNFF